ncbi:MAG: Fe-S protein assembly co-chaperone HscB [Fimbriimonadaceae bacterium]|nr:Fe-S protein assembly co-chaperone HscB [Chitinophagales bacterium]
MKYFELYEMPVSFLTDEKHLKKKYLELSKKSHPDFYTLESTEKQNEILASSTLNNKAYQTLNDFDKRIKYILSEKGYLVEEEKYVLPQIFLMEMLDLNELVLEVEFNPAKGDEVEKHLADAHKNLRSEIHITLENFDETKAEAEVYQRIKEFYYKRKYLLRIQEQLDKFATDKSDASI